VLGSDSAQASVGGHLRKVITGSNLSQLLLKFVAEQLPYGLMTCVKGLHWALLIKMVQHCWIDAISIFAIEA